MIQKEIARGRRFIIICGGGAVARQYQLAALKTTRLLSDDIDWLGIHATRLNGHLLRTIFRNSAHPKMITNPGEKVAFKEKILVAAGWRPGFSTDYDAVLLAKHYGGKTIINLSNVSFVYDKDPNKFKKAKPLSRLTWTAFRKIIGRVWSPGLNSPFDPVASRLAQKFNFSVFIANGKNLKNVAAIFAGQSFRGTVIEG